MANTTQTPLPEHRLPTHRKPGLAGSLSGPRATELPGAARAFQRAMSSRAVASAAVTGFAVSVPEKTHT